MALAHKGQHLLVEADADLPTKFEQPGVTLPGYTLADVPQITALPSSLPK